MTPISRPFSTTGEPASAVRSSAFVTGALAIRASVSRACGQRRRRQLIHHRGLQRRDIEDVVRRRTVDLRDDHHRQL